MRNSSRRQSRPSNGDRVFTKDALTSEILARLEADFPGVEFNFSQYLQDNVAEAVSGVKGENSIKLFRQRSADALRHG